VLLDIFPKISRSKNLFFKDIFTAEPRARFTDTTLVRGDNVSRIPPRETGEIVPRIGDSSRRCMRNTIGGNVGSYKRSIGRKGRKKGAPTARVGSGGDKESSQIKGP